VPSRFLARHSGKAQIQRLRIFLIVIPAKAGIQLCLNLREELDSEFRRNDEPKGTGSRLSPGWRAKGERPCCAL